MRKKILFNLIFGLIFLSSFLFFFRKTGFTQSNTSSNFSLETAAAPWSKRDSFSTVVFNNKIWLMGGRFTNSSGSTRYFYNDIWSLNLPPCLKKNQGDANCDGNVNNFDFDIWKCEFLGNGSCQNPSSQKIADFNLDTKVDLIDFEIWRRNLN
jgi:hypothetical protein